MLPVKSLKSKLNTDSYPAKVLIVTGPTASGKTELLDRAFGRGAFDFFPGLQAILGEGRVPPDHAEIISADSMQAYRGMDIGTAKPDRALLGRLPHHLIDIKNPDEQYTAGEFVTLADAVCNSLHGKNVLPVILGGTGFYIRNFIFGPASGPPSSASMRAEVARDLAIKGAAFLRGELEEADPPTALRIATNDIYRLTRAIEILRTSGEPPSRFAPSDTPRTCYDFLVLGIERPRGDLYERINARVGAMFAAGMRDEVERLKTDGYDASCPGLKAIGYREFFEMEGEPLEQIEAAVKLHTRHYAKRQMTFLRSLPGIVWIGPDVDTLLSAVRDFLAKP